MTKQIINVGATANDKQGDSLRAAFQKVNANFTELYTALGINEDTDLNLGAFEFSGSTMTTTDSSGIVIDQSTTVTSDLTVGGDILPQTANGGDLGSSAKPWRSLYVSDNTIFIGGTALGINQSGELTVDGSSVADNATPSWNNVTDKPTIPADIGDLTDTGNLLFDGNYVSLSNKPTIPTLGNFSFSANNITASSGAAPILLKIFGGDAADPPALISREWSFNTNGSITFPDGTTQTSAYTGGGDGIVEGSIYKIDIAGDDSTLLVDSNKGKIVGYVENDRFNVDGNDYQVRIGVGAGATTQGTDAIAIGEGAGNYQQGTRSIAIGRGSGNADQGLSAVGIGFCAGGAEQGDYAIAIGFKAGRGPMAGDPDPAQPNNSIIINASGDKLNGTNSGLYIDPVREDTGNTAKAVYYNTTTKELTYANPTGGGAVTGIESENDVSILVNLTDSTTRVWRFGEDGLLTLPTNGQVGDIFGESMTGIQADPSDPSSYASLVSGDKQQAIDVDNDYVTIWTDDAAQGGSSTNKWIFNRDGEIEFPDATVQTTAFTLSPTVNVLTIEDGVHEKFAPIADATGVVTHDYSTGHIFYHTSPDANWTMNLTNLNLASGYATTVTIIIEQGETGFYPSALQIGGAAQTINWQGNTLPTPSISRTDVVTFSIFNNSGTYTVLGQLAGF